MSPISMPTTATIKDLLAQLVSIPSISDQPKACHEALQWFKSQVQGLPFHQIELSHQGHPALLLTTRRTTRPKLLLMAHVDVVPGSPDTFIIREQDGKLIGRGVFDMKFAVAVYAQVLRSLEAELPQLDLGVMLTSDEEPGGYNTVFHLVDQGWRPQVVVNPDAIPDWHIQTAAKGSLRYRLESQGVTAHGSRPWLGQNPIKDILNFAGELERHFVAEPCGDPDHRHHTASINTIQAGEALNQIPARATAGLEIRVAPGTTIDQIDIIIRDIVSHYPRLTLTELNRLDPITIDPADPHIQHFARLITEHTGYPAGYSFAHGASDTNAFTAHGIPVIMACPPGGNHHGEGEWIQAAGLGQFFTILRQFILEAA